MQFNYLIVIRMAKSTAKYDISYRSLLDSFRKDKIPNNILLSIREKVLQDDLITIICDKFVGKNFDIKNNLIFFSAEDRQIESLINECSNQGLFSERRIVVLRNVKKLQKDAKLSLLDYLKNSNPDTCLLMISSDEEFAPDKIFLYNPKEPSESSLENKQIIEKNVRIFQISEFTESEVIKWTEEKFEGYKISKDTIKHFLRFTNYSFDEILSEIEKLKTYGYFTKEITTDAVNLCNGISKDFNETDFIKAITERKPDEALRIYDHISLKKDSEVYLVFLMNIAFTSINKLMDPNSAKLNDWNLRRELKLWFPDQERLIPHYRNFGKSIRQEQIAAAFDYIYSTDKLLKSSGGNRKTMMVSLINNICSL